MGVQRNAVVADLAERQHGVVGRRQLLEEGLSRAQVDALVRRGRLARVASGTYRVVGAPTTPASQVMTAVLRSGPGAVACGERMLALLGVREAGIEGPFVVLVPRGRRLARVDHGWRVDRWPGLGARANVLGVPSLTPARNLLEAAAATSDVDHLHLLADGVRRRRRAGLADVASLVGQAPDHPGARRLLLSGCLDVDAPESAPERLLAALLQPLGVETQVRLVPGVRVDFLLRRARVVVEYDGSEHSSGRRRGVDAERDARLAAHGYVVVRVTREDLRDPAALLVRILAAAP